MSSTVLYGLSNSMRYARKQGRRIWRSASCALKWMRIGVRSVAGLGCSSVIEIVSAGLHLGRGTASVWRKLVAPVVPGIPGVGRLLLPGTTTAADLIFTSPTLLSRSVCVVRSVVSIAHGRIRETTPLIVDVEFLDDVISIDRIIKDDPCT
jgi:hypothetical protein